MLYTKEWYALMEAFEKGNFGRYRLDREEKEVWQQKVYYQNGEANELFKVYLAGYMNGRATYMN